MDSPISTPTPPAPSSSQSSPLIPILATITLLSLSTSVFFYYRYSKLQDQLSKIQAIIPIPTPTAGIDSTANWKSYTYKEISFKFPEDWNFLVDNNNLYLSQENLRSGLEYSAITFRSFDNPKEFSLKDFDEKFGNVSPGIYLSSAESRIVSGVTGYFQKNVNCEPHICDRFVISYNKTIYFINNIYKEQVIDDQRRNFDQILSTFKFTDNQPGRLSLSPTTTVAPKITKTIHPYPFYDTNPSRSINKIHIISLLFIPKGINTPIKPEWNINMGKINQEIKLFFEKQFTNNIQITYQATTQLVDGDNEIESYTPTSLVAEATTKTLGYTKPDSYNIRMVYLVRDLELKRNLQGGSLGGLASQQAATQFEFWLDNDAVNSSNQYGVVGSAHEFAHSLGIPHPWELPTNTSKDPNYGNVAGDLMGYSNQGKLQGLYIRDDVKKTMGL